MVEEVSGSEYESLQHFISNSPWDSKGLMLELFTKVELKSIFFLYRTLLIEELYAFYLSVEPRITKTTVNWRISSLVKTNVIQRTGRGTYKYGPGKTLLPEVSHKAMRINNFMKTNFPYLKYIIWHISELNSLSLHLINKDTYYVEVERDAIDSVFEQLRDEFKYVLRVKSNQDMYFGESIIVVRPLISGSPTQLISDVPTTTIEKLLVDFFTDKEFEFLHGYELTHIFNNAFSKYTINIDRLLRYASRKAKRTKIEVFINTIK
jgi:hypothetical protein